MYRPDQKSITNLIETAKQVNKLIVVDNGSGVEIEEQLDKVSQIQLNIEVIKNKQNLGIDKATNIGIKKYINQYKYVLTLDQDSELQSNMVMLLESAFDKISDNTCVMVGPNIANNGTDEQGICEKYQKVDLLIASGCLIKTDYLKKYGLLDEYFFIDCNDTDLSLRIGSQGFSLYKIKEAKLNHSMGYCTTHTFLGKQIITENYSPFRRYFRSRNSMEILKRYFWKYPKLVSKFWYISHVKANVKIIFFEKDKLNKLKSGFLGTYDWFFKKGFKAYY